MKRKVLFIESGMGFGGAAVSLYELSSSLKNYEPVVLFFTAENEEFTNQFKYHNTYFLNAHFTYRHKSDFYRKLNTIVKNAFLRYLISKLYTFASILDDYTLFTKIRKIAKSERVSIIHINNCIHPLPLKVAQRLKIPAVVHLRGHVDCAGKEKENINKLIHTLIAPTKKIRDFATRKLNVDIRKIKVIYNSVNVELYNAPERGKLIRKQYNISETTSVIGMFARIIPMKGQLELAKAVHKLLCENHNIKCMFIGDKSDGDIEYFNTLKDYVESCRFSNRFIFTGYCSNVHDFYNAIDIAVHGSIANEAFGRVIIESWAARRPVIATDIAASTELIDDEKTGIIVPVGEIDKLSAAILRLTTNPDERKTLADNGYKQVEKYFSNKIVADSVESIYRSLT